MENSKIFISKQSVEDALYSRLQRLTVDELQRLSGQIWTDFNAHDPGVTIADVANYILTELDYKLGFDLLDYLTDQNGEFSPGKYGLYLPEEIYPTTPVTLDDYRKSILLKFPQLNNVAFIRDKQKKGYYDLHIELNPFSSEDQHELKEKVHYFFHENRNLCENINEILIYTPPPLSLHAEIEIEVGTDATMLLVEYYHVIQQYLAGSIRIEEKEEQIHSNIPLDEWFEITNNESQRVVIPKQYNTETDLYLKLLKIKGIKAIKTNYLVTRASELKSKLDVASETKSKLDIVPDLKAGYSLYVPKYQDDLKVKIFIENIEVIINLDCFIEELKSVNILKSSSQYKKDYFEWKNNSFSPLESSLQGTYRDVYTHKNMACDFPSHYGISEAGLAMSVSEEQKAYAKQLKAYLTLFDLIIRRGLSELKGFQDLLTIDDHDSVDAEQTIISEKQWNQAMRDISTKKSGDNEIVTDGGGDYHNITNKNKFRVKNRLKDKYLDFLDELYGVDSHPKWMNEYHYYGETDKYCLKQRMKFLQIIPSLTRNRSKAINIYDVQTENNLSNLKIYISTLLNLNLDENLVVGNILNRHNLSLCNDSAKYIISKEYEEYEAVRLSPAPQTNSEKLKEYTKLRQELTYFNSNEICGGVFRGGTELNNYKLIKKNDEQEFILTFWNNEECIWMNLERSNDKEILNNSANILRRYLIELNRKSEVVYVIEHIFFYPIDNNDKQSDYKFDDPLTITIVFPNWSARFNSYRFREICNQLIESITPAHIKANIYWMDHIEIKSFENSYRKWKVGLSKNSPEEEMRQLQQGIYDVLLTMESKK